MSYGFFYPLAELALKMGLCHPLAQQVACMENYTYGPIFFAQNSQIGKFYTQFVKIFIKVNYFG